MMTHSVPRRAKNSLSRAKFIARLNKGLPIFTAHGWHNFILRGDKCRDLHLNRGCKQIEFVTVTTEYPHFTHVGHVSLLDMNVERNDYNRNFAFRTQRAADRYLAEGI